MSCGKLKVQKSKQRAHLESFLRVTAWWADNTKLQLLQRWRVLYLIGVYTSDHFVVDHIGT